MTDDLTKRLRAADPSRETAVQSILAGLATRDLRGGAIPSYPAEHRDRPRVLPRASVLVVGGLFLTIAVVAYAMSGRGTGEAQAAILDRAIVAVTPPADTIIHIRQRLMQASAVVTTESWQSSADPTEYRYRQVSSSCPAFVTEQSVTNQQQQELDPREATVYTTKRNAVTAAASWPAAGPRSLFDPTVAFAAAVKRGEAKVVGETTINGHSAQRLEWPGDPGSDPGNQSHNELLVDAKTGAPLEVISGGGKLDGSDGAIQTIHFVTYEFLPSTASSRANLSILTANTTATRTPLASEDQLAKARQAAQLALCGGVG